MQALLDTTHSFFVWLLRASWQASVLILLVLLAQLLLRKHLAPRWRHALWFLVLVRLALPVSIESRLSLFNVVRLRSPAPAAVAMQPGSLPGVSEDQSAINGASHSDSRPSRSWWMGWPLLWLTGVVVLPVGLLASTWRLGRKVKRQRPVTDSAVLDLLEDCKQEMGVSTPLLLVETPAVSSPSLFGFIRPRLLLPAGLLHNFSLAELRYVFLHELGHVKRGDIPLNWLTTASLVLHWFNPLVWFAFNQMRADGELACDALALSHTRETESKSYGQTIIKLLERFSRPSAAPGLVGILENRNQMKTRISMIAKFKKSSSWPIAAGALFATLALVTLTDAQSATSVARAANGRVPTNAEEPSKDPQAPPRIIATVPQVGETEVNPAITEITVTFDRDMAGGFSWTGGGPDYPALPEGQKPQWRDKRTCLLPVKLEAARYYRVGINSKSFRNFRSMEGVSADPSAIFFTTQGASEELKSKTAQPQIVAVYPYHQATDVDPNLTELSVTFNIPMGEGFSWTGGGPDFPTIPEGKKPSWSADHKTCVLPVELKPNWEYRIGLNSPSHNNFQSAAGVPLPAVVYTFKTRP
jgi:bla regulator protein BlaR1